MKESVLKYLFFTFSGLIFILMLLTSRDAGITCDEVLHYNHSVSVYNYFATGGNDQSALNTPVTQLKYYGQSYDNLVTILIKWFHIEDIYGFRHIMSFLAGWLAVMVTALFAAGLSGYRAGILVIALFAVSPTFMGHSQNNLKDIPFALGYISSIYFILRFVSSGRNIPLKYPVMLTLSIAFTLSIRSGGLLLICYLCLFLLLYWFWRYLNHNRTETSEIRIKVMWIGIITAASWLLSIMLWPFALQSPVKNVLQSYHVMAHFPETFRQIFEGKVEWSDFMPWYYLLKSMVITIPLLVSAGFCVFFLFLRRTVRDESSLQYLFILFSIFFPVIFVIYEKSNLYSSWRQFLFLYPGIILIAATGLNFLFESISKVKYSGFGMVLLIGLLSIHPVKFMALNHRYSYIYYNQLVGGLNGAYGNYETDYYYVSQTEASEWLLNYLKVKKDTGVIKIKSTYSVNWQFRNHPETETSYFRWEERSMSDWDYAIVANRYISPFQLKNSIWPPDNSIHIIYAEKIPVCAVIERKSKDDLKGYNALISGRNEEAIGFFEKALQVDRRDEMIFYNFAIALYNRGYYQKSDSLLRMGLQINPDFETILMYLGNIARSQNRIDDAISFYERVIKVNRKYFEAYVGLAELVGGKDLMKAREELRTCLKMNPAFKPAIVALADTYRISDPDIARKYDELANSIGPK
jgi:tetratricopeptide (TPR) repeat protein